MIREREINERSDIFCKIKIDKCEMNFQYIAGI